MRTTTQPGRAHALHRWMLALLVLVAAAVHLLGAGNAYAAPAAGTVIGNQATATYVDASSTTRNATSNLVQTTVSQVKSFTLDTTGQTRTAAPGQTVYYPHYITNTGNGTDTYTLNAPTSGTFAGPSVGHSSLAYYIDANGDGVPDNSTAITTSGPVAAGGVFRFVVAGTVPGAAASGNTADITVSATDTTPTTRTNTDTTSVANSVITVTKSLSATSGAGGVSLTVTLAYTNSGTAAATNLTITDALPANMTYVGGSGRWSVSGATALTDSAADGFEQGGATGINYSVTGTTVTALIGQVNAGVSGNVSFSVSIPANLAPQTINNTASYTTATQTTSANTNTGTYTVTQSAGVAFNGSAASSATNANDALTVASANAGGTITYENYVWNTGNQSDTFDITTVSSSFPAGTSISMYQQDGVTTLINSAGTAAADTGPIPGRNQTCNAPYVSVGGVCGYKVVVKVTLPATATAAGAPFNLVLRATSVFNTSSSDDMTNTLTTIAANSVDVTNDAVSPTVAGNGEGAGTNAIIKTNTVTPAVGSTMATRFLVFVRNEGAVADTYTLSATLAATSVAGVTPPALPSGWSVAFRSSSNGTDCNSPGGTITATNALAANASQLLCAEVTIPATSSGTATAGDYDFDFKATSQTNAAVTDYVRNRVTVSLVRSISLTPNNTQQTFAGSSVTYTHTLANTGNASDTVNFAAGCLGDSRSAQGWTSTAYIDANGDGVLQVGTDTLIACGTTNVTLAVNASRTIFVRVFAPGSAQGTDPANVTTLTATYSTTVSATDSTSVTDGLLLIKEQTAIATPCSSNNPSGYTQNAIAAGPNTAPGSCIAYRITATNTTAGTISNVVISDNIPANTKIKYSCSGNSVSSPSVWVGATQLTNPLTQGGITQTVADGGTGTLRATILSLTSTQSATLYFCVQIDP